MSTLILVVSILTGLATLACVLYLAVVLVVFILMVLKRI